MGFWSAEDFGTRNGTVLHICLLSGGGGGAKSGEATSAVCLCPPLTKNNPATAE